MEISPSNKKGYVLRGGKRVSSVCDLLKLSISEFEEVFKYYYKRQYVEDDDTEISLFFVRMREWFTDYPSASVSQKNIISSYLEKTKECKGRNSWVTHVSYPRVYRGISRSVEDIRRVKLSSTTIDSYILGTVIYNPKHRVQSWTRDRERAFLFRGSDPSVDWIGSLQWIMSFKPSAEEVIFGSQFTELVSPMPSEREVVISIPDTKKVTVAINLAILFALDDSMLVPKRFRGKTLEDTVGKENAEMIRSSKWYRNHFNITTKNKP